MKNELQEVLDLIIRSVDPEKVILFGSRAREISRENSDNDLCIIKKDIDKRQVAQEIHLQLALNRIILPIDLIVETPTSFAKNKDNQYLIYYDINKNGKVVYER